MTKREKLLIILAQIPTVQTLSEEADYLFAHGVTVAERGYWIFKNRTKLMPTGIAKVTEDKTAIVVKKHITVTVPYCSICGDHGDDEGDAMPFCPNCGADMRGGENENT